MAPITRRKGKSSTRKSGPPSLPVRPRENGRNTSDAHVTERSIAVLQFMRDELRKMAANREELVDCATFLHREASKALQRRRVAESMRHTMRAVVVRFSNAIRRIDEIIGEPLADNAEEYLFEALNPAKTASEKPDSTAKELIPEVPVNPVSDDPAADPETRITALTDEVRAYMPLERLAGVVTSGFDDLTESTTWDQYLCDDLEDCIGMLMEEGDLRKVHEEAKEARTRLIRQQNYFLSTFPPMEPLTDAMAHESLSDWLRTFESGQLPTTSSMVEGSE